VGGALQIARRAHIERARVDVRQPLAAALRAARPAFEAAAAHLEAAEHGRPLHTTGDVDMLERLFLNLLLNAAEALSPGGSARVEAALEDREVVVRISDDGCGVPPARLRRVFEPFFTTREDGTGLGLPVARRIARVHGGEVTLESAAGAGTTVSVRLPWAEV